MKAFLFLALGLLAVSPLEYLQAESVGTIHTLRGKTYHGCEIVRVHPDGVSFTHRNGAAKVLFEDLSRDWRIRLGYDSKKAEAYEKEIAERRRREAEARAERNAELSKAMALAQQMEWERLRLQRIQALGMQAAMFNAQAPWALPVAGFDQLPALGAVHDGRGIYRAFRHNRVTWDSRGLVPITPGTGGVVMMTSGGIQFFSPRMWCSPTLGCYVPGSPFPIGGGVRTSAAGRPANTVISVPK